MLRLKLMIYIDIHTKIFLVSIVFIMRIIQSPFLADFCILQHFHYFHSFNDFVLSENKDKLPVTI